MLRPGDEVYENRDEDGHLTGPRVIIRRTPLFPDAEAAPGDDLAPELPVDRAPVTDPGGVSVDDEHAATGSELTREQMLEELAGSVDVDVDAFDVGDEAVVDAQDKFAWVENPQTRTALIEQDAQEPAEPTFAAVSDPQVEVPAGETTFRVDAAGGRGDAGWGPAGPSRRAVDNLEALRTLRAIQEQDRPATGAEQQVLGRWTSWGALPKMFDDDAAEFDQLRGQLRGLLDEQEWKAARHTTINAHYTSPAYASQMWSALQGLGFQGGQVLEPGCGAGVFMGLAPQNARMVGVELDPVTAQITAALYPGATVRAESFAESPFPDGMFDAVIGNVPFGDVKLFDPNHNPGRAESIHNHFILKSLALTRPGGVVAVLTAGWTLDRVDDTARRNMWQMADLVTAVRLPTGAHRQVAGTDALTDVLVFRVRGEGERPPGPLDEPSWLQTTEVDVPRKEDPSQRVEVDVNGWFVEHPELVLGELMVGHGMYHADGLRVINPDLAGVGDRLQRVMSDQVRAAVDAGMGFAVSGEPTVEADQVAERVAEAGDITRFEGHISRTEDGSWRQLTSGVVEPMSVPASQEKHLAGLVRLRDVTVRLLDAEAASSEDTEHIAALRAQLNTAYDGFVSRFGPVNKVTVTETKRLDKHGSPIVSRRFPAAMRTFKADPHSPVVMALESYNEGTGVAQKAPIFTSRVVAPQVVRTSADSPQDAVAMLLDQVGQVRVGDVARLLDVDEVAARRQLGTLVFDDPATVGRLVPAAQYLSGNVREALQLAQEKAVDRPELAVNVAELEKVIPRDLLPGEIEARLGAVWIPEADVRQFLTETLNDDTIQVLHTGGSKWSVRGDKYSQAATSTWGTERMPAPDMAERLMRQQRVVVENVTGGEYGEPERRVVNPVETEAAQAKADALQERFAEWVWEDPERSTRLARDYNDRFNAVVLRSYAEEGNSLSLPGLASWFTPHDHQRAAVARMRAEPSVGLFHQVGAGKTAEMVMGATELKRLGLVNKPTIVVPNHMLEQFTREWLGLYPRANILAAASEDLRGDKRRQFIARVATGDWDGVVMTQGAFGSIPVTNKAAKKYLSAEMDDLEQALSRARNAQDDQLGRVTIKNLEKRRDRTEERLKERLAKPRDPGLCWEQTGIDYLLVDELHMYKNLGIASNITDVASDGSQRAQDLDMKLMLLREKAGSAGRVITGATATPIANSISEAYVMQRYLRPDLLEGAGITDFDAWAATFGTQVTQLEMAPQGGGWRMMTRFAKFQNLPELLRLWHVAADVKTAADLNLPVPDLAERADGQRVPETVLVPPTQELQAFMVGLGERAEMVKSRAVDPSEDNMLKICGDGRKAAMDLRMVGIPEPDGLVAMTKLDVAAARIHQIWASNRDNTYPVSADDPTQHPVPGGFQIVFADLGTPTSSGWNVYEALREKLAGHGMDGSRVRFVHEANNDAKKGRLFAACRDGGVDVLIGSTAKMGVGTNIQHRAVALHHLDCPWRPSDVEQREGRIVRQGNANPQVQILRYATEKSFDAYMWQTVERKGKFIDQVMHGSLDQRSAEDIDSSSTLSFAEVKALSAGNPLLLEKTQAEADLNKYQRLESAFNRDQSRRQHEVVRQEGIIDRVTNETIPALQEAIAARVPTGGEAFSAAVGGQWFTERPKVAEAIRARIGEGMFHLSDMRHDVPVTGLLEMGGHTFDATISQPVLGQTPMVSITMRGVPGEDLRMDRDSLNAEGYGLVTKLENRLSGLDHDLGRAETAVQTAHRELDEARKHLGDAFPHAEDLHAAREKVEAIDAQMNAAEQQSAEPDDKPEPVARSQAEINAEGIARVWQKVADLQSAQQSRLEDDAEAPGAWSPSPTDRLDQTHPQYQREGRIQVTGRRDPGHGPRM